MYTICIKKTTSNEVNQNSTIKVKRKIKKSYNRHSNRTRIICTYATHKEFVLLRRAISLKVNYEKIKFSNCVFCDNFSDYKLTYM